jgi:chromosome segregation ATPase
MVGGAGLEERTASVAENIRSRQDHIEFLENYIVEITLKIDELTGERDIEKAIHSLEYRIEVLEKAEGKFAPQIKELKNQLKDVKTSYDKIKPTLDELAEERAYYRHMQSQL